MKKLIATTLLGTMLFTCTPANAGTLKEIDKSITRVEEHIKDSIKDAFYELPTGVKIGIILGGGTITYVVISNPKMATNAINAIMKNKGTKQLFNTRANRAGYKHLLKTGRIKIKKYSKPKVKYPEYKTLEELLKDL